MPPPPDQPPTHSSANTDPHRRLSALIALALGLIAIVLLAAVAIRDRGRGMPALLLAVSALVLAWQGFRRQGRLRVVAIGAGGLVLIGFLVLLVARQPLLTLGTVLATALAVTAARHALSARVPLAPMPRPRHPVLFYNPRSGGGKASRFHLADESHARGVEAIELSPGTDLAQLVHRAIDAGADALAMAGGDGSQAIVAAIAAERGVPYACIPSGTRNHFALDLGVDREDVVGALDALVDGGERVVDLGEVNGRVFVNNVSVGLYGEAVQQASYRNAKLRTLLEAVPEVLGPNARLDLRWRGPDGAEHEGSAMLVVSNNPYRLESPIGAGGRARLDQGVLGVAMLTTPDAGGELRSWVAPSFEIAANAPVAAGVDGEALVFDPPLRFRIRPAALRCRIARHHPGASPAALAPQSASVALRALVSIAAGARPSV
ncbi:MAG: diacylglycerol kinase family protein [Verrucomicrobiota bacterium]